MADQAAIEMPSPPLPKKRRIELPATAACKTLTKPFKSPLRSTPSSGNTNAFPFPTTAHTSSKLKRSSDDSISLASEKTAIITTTTSIKPPTSTHSHTSYTPARLPSRTTALTPSPQQQIQSLRSTLHTLTQATSLLTTVPSPDNELAILTSKWKSIARAAAEEVYATTRDRVNRMGGVGAWRARERERASRWDDVDEEQAGGGVDEESSDEGDDEDDEGDKEEREARRALKEETRRAREDAKAEAQAEREALKREKEQEESKTGGVGGTEGGRDDDAFTMGMMLKTLHIELDVLGWDAVEGRWTD